MIRTRSNMMPTSAARGFKSMKPTQGMGRPIMSQTPLRDPQNGLTYSPEQLKALQDVPRPEYVSPYEKGNINSLAENVSPGMAGTTEMKKGGVVKKTKKSSSASKRADGIATKGKTRGRMV